MIRQASKVLLAAALAFGATGCGHSYTSHGRHHHHRHRSDAVDMIAAGLFVGAAIVDLAASTSRSSPEPEPEPVPVYRTYTYDAPTPTPTPRSARDAVPEDAASPLFDAHAARAALNAVDVSSCRSAGAPAGYGHARVTVNPDGVVSKVVVDEPRGLSAAAAKCLGDRIGAATVPPYRGSLVTMGTSFRID